MAWSTFLILTAAARLSSQVPLVHRADTLNINVPQNVPGDAPGVVPKSYAGLAISAHSFNDYAGNKASPNTFSKNLVSQIADKTGTAVHIRVGGTSGDFSVFDANQNTALVLPSGAKPGGIPKGIKIGSQWFEGFQNFPGVQWTYSTHFANNSAGQRDNSVQAVKAALKNIGSNLEAIEIGNEIDAYPGVNRPKDYSVVSYLDEWFDYSNAIQKGALAGTQYSNAAIYQGPVFLNLNSPFLIKNALEKGQNKNKNIKSASLHHYMSGSATAKRQSDFMNHTRVAKQLDAYKAPIATLQQLAPGVSLHLGEVNSNTYSQEDIRSHIGVFGSALWLADYLLYGASIGISRMNVQQSTGFSYASWRPVAYNGLQPAVLPPWYGHVFAADVIGKGSDVRISDLKLGLDKFSAYGVYDAGSGKLSKVVLINLEDWEPSQGARPTKNVQLSVGSGATNVKVEKLVAGSAGELDASKISWKGTSWTYASKGLPVGTPSSTTVKAQSGKIAVSVPASQAFLLTL